MRQRQFLRDLKRRWMPGLQLFEHLDAARHKRRAARPHEFPGESQLGAVVEQRRRIDADGRIATGQRLLRRGEGFTLRKVEC